MSKSHGIDHTINGGDFSTDFCRYESPHSIYLTRFMSDETLFEPDNDIDYTYESMVAGDRSVLDHFLISDNLRDNIVSYRVLHEGDNTSDHDPICIS